MALTTFCAAAEAALSSADVLREGDADRSATYFDLPGFISLTLCAQFRLWQLIRLERAALNSCAVEIMMWTSLMRLHPNGLAVASHRQ